MRKYFGTDGIRGRVGDEVINPQFVTKLGWAAGKVLARKGVNTVLIGKDTRISGYMLESALESGLSAAGINVALLGPMPTPAVAYLTRTFRAEAGIVISASHNPYGDNGIKFFSADGLKLDDDVEMKIEALLDEPMTCVPSDKLGKAKRIEDAAGRYIEYCKGNFPSALSLEGMKVVVDCAHGATYHIAPSVLSELGADVVTIGAEPNGLNINEKVGATDVRALQQKVIDEQADVGIALDGDGDRLVMVDQHGEPVDGDQLLYILARDCLKRGVLGNTGVVGTLMTNLGAEQAFMEMGIPFVRSDVGDRYVMQVLKERGWFLGGEGSGHIIDLANSTTGDGVLAAVQVLTALLRSETDMASLASGMVKYPQQLTNVRLPRKIDITTHPDVEEAVMRAEASLGESGRVLLRNSGTEPLLRIMVEAEDESDAERHAHAIAFAVKGALR